MQLPDSKIVAAMTPLEFDQFWDAMGIVVRLAASAEHRPEEARREISNTSAGTERRWSPVDEAPASARASIGFGP